MKTINLKQLRGALASALMITGAYVIANILGAHDAMAQQTMGNIFTNVQTNLKQGAGVIYTAAYLGGTTALMMGAFKLKAHAENPSNTPMAHGLSRLAVGAGLIALPSVGNTILNTAGNTATDSLTVNSSQVGIN